LGAVGDSLPTAFEEAQMNYEAKKSVAEVVVERYNQ